jgi:hypothetical protein
MMNDAMYFILKLVVAIAVILTTRYIVPLIKSKVNDGTLDQVYNAVLTAVRAAEQTETVGTVKKTKVLSYIQSWLADNNITISMSQLDNIIEECVYLLNEEKTS